MCCLVPHTEFCRGAGGKRDTRVPYVVLCTGGRCWSRRPGSPRKSHFFHFDGCVTDRFSCKRPLGFTILLLILCYDLLPYMACVLGFLGTSESLSSLPFLSLAALLTLTRRLPRRPPTACMTDDSRLLSSAAAQCSFFSLFGPTVFPHLI
jgi:hypothetical protein